MIRQYGCVVLAILSLACATSEPQYINAPVLVPRAGETVAVDQVVVLIDASSSVGKRTLFPEEKALVESFAKSMPDGDYEAGSITFGGFERDSDPLSRFERRRVTAEAASIEHLAEGTPIHKAIAEAGSNLEGRQGRAAIVLYSDGLLTDEVGREIDPQLAFDAVEAVEAAYPGTICLHTVQTGDDAAGAEFLRELAASTECGSFRTADRVTNVAALQEFERDVFFGEAPPQVAAAPRDADGDGVIDANDDCPGTPRNAAVDPRGCWVVRGLLFAHDSAAIDAAGKSGLDEVAHVLRANPDLRVRLAGHTDATGTDEYNRALSDRRAEAARGYLVSAGIAKNRVEAEGFGESQPAADNETPEGRRQNRRTVVEIVSD